MTELAKTFEPGPIEAKWYSHWEENGLFRPERPDAEPYTIVNPPPNVTGSLHIGHALDNTLQDIMIRYERLRGKDALWVVGTDHAGIATQMVVERQLEAKQDKRTNYSRDDFIKKVWEWKEESGGQITRQLRRLGCSMDWSREQFTMDPHFTEAVLKVFVDLYNHNLIYRDKRLVNWDPKLKTAISDLEVESREVAGHMWHFKYPLAGGETYTYVEKDEDGNVTLTEERDYISIATTRPETMLGDGAVAVHPSDERYAPIVGKLCEIPVGPKEHRRLIPIITDDYPDPTFGSGAVKITGAHDENDYGVATRNNIPMYRLMDEVAAMRTDGASYAADAARAVEIAKGAETNPKEVDSLNLVPDEYRGLDRYEARKRVVADIDAEGNMIIVEDKMIMQPFGDRGGVVIEPMLTDQWYVNAEELAKKPIEAVKSGSVEIVPKTWEKTFFNWMENIQPWCVSRQLWWGHRIPAWYGPTIHKIHETGDILYSMKETVPFVATTADEAAELAQKYYSNLARERGWPVEHLSVVAVDAVSRDALHDGEVQIWRDNDVLDTWFSSALWPFATLGWPEKTDLLDKHYPNDLLVSGFDILFFWDARMMMMGRQLTGENPWPRLYLHGLVRAADGQKMSKSKGNVVDPLGLVDQYGADALRFFMAAMESQGRDIKMDDKRVEGYRNFATKIWNAARFLQFNGIGASDSIAAPKAEKPVNRWIIGEVVETLAKLEKAFDELRFDGMADAIYHFTWGTFCDWYLELIKGDIDEETKAVAAWAFDQILVMLHPFMPFITEELWGAMGAGERDHYPLITAKWPEPEASVDAAAKAEIETAIAMVTEIRALRSELNIPWSSRLTLHPMEAGAASGGASLDRMGKADMGAVIETPPPGSAQIVVQGKSYAVPLADAIDLDAERSRLTKAVDAAEKEVKSLEGRLNNANFVERAKPEAVEKARADHAARSEEAGRLRAALERLA
ncbi:valine--tRNA ligase [Sphingomicrobium flavum]|uniref:valine--tRNA ligase n=1 Tax=Sphingomicrobium flavum TaxID=1229164 RepID=UPI0021AE281C|nr:valine--tRNA ligase [Sphingomicrobium flavum]